MMGAIFSNDFIDYTPTARSADSDYPVTDIDEKWSLTRTFKAADATANDWLIKLDMTSAQTVASILLNHVNFTSVTIQGNATDSWGAPSFTTTISISKDPIVQRYKAFIPLTAFNYRYLRIFIPTGQTPTDDTVWYVGGLVALDSYTELSRNASMFDRTAEIPNETVEIGGNVKDSVDTAAMLGLECSLGFSKRKQTDESELWTLNALSNSTPMVLYENLSDTSQAWLVRKEGGYKGTLLAGLITSGNTIDFEEIGT